MVTTLQDRALQATRDRAVAIYRWALDNPESFTAQKVPGYFRCKQEQRAYEMLTHRGLLKRVNFNRNLPHWRLDRVCDPEDCMAITAVVDPAFRGLTSYRVPLSVAENMGDSPNLRQYAVGGVRKW